MTRNLVFTVPDMDCSGCVRSITDAVHQLDAGANITADLHHKTVQIATQSTADFAAAIVGAGFSPVAG